MIGPSIRTHGIIWRMRKTVMSSKTITEDALFYVNNLEILQEHIPNESVYLIFLDPPFIPTAILTFSSL